MTFGFIWYQMNTSLHLQSLWEQPVGAGGEMANQVYNAGVHLAWDGPSTSRSYLEHHILCSGCFGQVCWVFQRLRGQFKSRGQFYGLLVLCRWRPLNHNWEESETNL